ncbi:MAG: hypothetical protein JW727_02255 [Candidatus Aenigmarchaeota archaeon]|nr:hypothetical protein [Candidatus Aenigmarchaeota archaeon]
MKKAKKVSAKAVKKSVKRQAKTVKTFRAKAKPIQKPKAPAKGKNLKVKKISKVSVKTLRLKKGAQQGPTFLDYFTEVQTKYNEEVKVLLRGIDKAEAEGNLQMLATAKVASDGYGKFFFDLKADLKKEKPADPKGAKVVNEYLDEQIAFFASLSREIENRLKQNRLSDLRKALE